jgi:hypothetical protein
MTRLGPDGSTDLAVSKASCFPPKHSRLPKGTHTMSEQKPSSFMQELDKWTESTIIEPLADAGDEDLYLKLVEDVKKAIRAKVLESYRNGLKAGPRTAKEPQKGGR